MADEIEIISDDTNSGTLNFDGIQTIDPSSPPAPTDEGVEHEEEVNGDAQSEPGDTKKDEEIAHPQKEGEDGQKSEDGTGPQPTPANEELDGIQTIEESEGDEHALELPPGTTPKASEQFAKLKKITARERELRLAAEKRAADAEAKARTIPPEVEQELKTLRAKVAEIDVTMTPEVKAFDKVISENEAAITEICMAYPALTKVIQSVEKIGSWKEAAEKTNLLEKIGPVLRPADKVAIEQLIGATRQAEIRRGKTIQQLAQNIENTKAQQAQQAQQETEQLIQEATAVVAERRKSLKWLVPNKVDPKDGPEVKKAKEAHNRFVAEVENALKEKLQVDGKTILKKLAELAFDSIEAKKLKRDLDEANARIKELEKTVTEVRKVGSIKAKPSASPAPTTQPKSNEVDWDGLRNLDTIHH